MKTNPNTKKATAQLTVRVSDDLRRFYEESAERERRRLSDMLRIALEDQRSAMTQRQQTAA